MERSNGPCEREGARVHVRRERCGNVLIPKRSGHMTKGLQFARCQRRWECQDDVEREAGPADGPFDICNWKLGRRRGCRSACGRRPWCPPRRGYLVAASRTPDRVHRRRRARCSLPGDCGGTPTKGNVRQSCNQGITGRCSQDQDGSSSNEDGCCPASPATHRHAESLTLQGSATCPHWSEPVVELFPTSGRWDSSASLGAVRDRWDWSLTVHGERPEGRNRAAFSWSLGSGGGQRRCQIAPHRANRVGCGPCSEEPAFHLPP